MKNVDVSELRKEMHAVDAAIREALIAGNIEAEMSKQQRKMNKFFRIQRDALAEPGGGDKDIKDLFKIRLFLWGFTLAWGATEDHSKAFLEAQRARLKRFQSGPDAVPTKVKATVTASNVKQTVVDTVEPHITSQARGLMNIPQPPLLPQGNTTAEQQKGKGLETPANDRVPAPARNSPPAHERQQKGNDSQTQANDRVRTPARNSPAADKRQPHRPAPSHGESGVIVSKPRRTVENPPKMLPTRNEIRDSRAIEDEMEESAHETDDDTGSEYKEDVAEMRHKPTAQTSEIDELEDDSSSDIRREMRRKIQARRPLEPRPLPKRGKKRNENPCERCIAYERACWKQRTGRGACYYCSYYKVKCSLKEEKQRGVKPKPLPKPRAKPTRTPKAQVTSEPHSDGDQARQVSRQGGRSRNANKRANVIESSDDSDVEMIAPSPERPFARLENSDDDDDAMLVNDGDMGIGDIQPAREDTPPGPEPKVVQNAGVDDVQQQMASRIRELEEMCHALVTVYGGLKLKMTELQDNYDDVRNRVWVTEEFLGLQHGKPLMTLYDGQREELVHNLRPITSSVYDDNPRAMSAPPRFAEYKKKIRAQGEIEGSAAELDSGSAAASALATNEKEIQQPHATPESPLGRRARSELPASPIRNKGTPIVRIIPPTPQRGHIVLCNPPRTLEQARQASHPFARVKWYPASPPPDDDKTHMQEMEDADADADIDTELEADSHHGFSLTARSMVPEPGPSSLPAPSDISLTGVPGSVVLDEPPPAHKPESTGDTITGIHMHPTVSAEPAAVPVAEPVAASVADAAAAPLADAAAIIACNMDDQAADVVMRGGTASNIPPDSSLHTPDPMYLRAPTIRRPRSKSRLPSDQLRRSPRLRSPSPVPPMTTKRPLAEDTPGNGREKRARS